MAVPATFSISPTRLAGIDFFDGASMSLAALTGERMLTAINLSGGFEADQLQGGLGADFLHGFDGDDQPRGVLTVENGKATAAGAYDGQEMNWDIRASADQWQKWIAKPPGMMGLGMAFTSRKMKFMVGDYSSMIKDPRMAGPFIKSFSVMGRA